MSPSQVNTTTPSMNNGQLVKIITLALRAVEGGGVVIHTAIIIESLNYAE